MRLGTKENYTLNKAVDLSYHSQLLVNETKRIEYLFV